MWCKIFLFFSMNIPATDFIILCADAGNPLWRSGIPEAGPSHPTRRQHNLELRNIDANEYSRMLQALRANADQDFRS
ncbi:MAG TPA: hypothetical protein DD706_11085 [Nitrospiraceae bacterium]|nr:hypothetical protein [Nitrospiraceae bacterium]